MTAPNKTENITSPGNYNLFTAMWMPQGQPKALIHIVHGYGEHLMRYDNVAARLIAEGYIVYAHDHYGHGRSDGEKGDIIEYNNFIRDLHFLVKRESAEHPGLAVILLGHSMGGNISLHAVLEDATPFRGIILIAPLVTMSTDSISPVTVFFAKQIACCLPRLVVYNIQKSLLTRNKESLKSIEEDDLTFQFITAKFGINLLSGKIGKDRLKELKIALLVLHGTEDQIVKFSESRYLFKNASSPDKTLAEFREAYHQLHQELFDVTEEFFRRIFNWIEERI